MGSWKDQSLLEAVDILDRIGFICYWAGKKWIALANHQLLARAPPCSFLVQCCVLINRHDSQMRSVAQDMQKRFLSTLAFKRLILLCRRSISVHTRATRKRKPMF